MAEGKQNLQNAAIIAKLFGVTDRRIQQLAKDGIIPAAQKRPYMFDLLPTVQPAMQRRHASPRGCCGTRTSSPDPATFPSHL